MPRLLVKPVKDEDFYVYYSTIVDMPVDWGTRADFEEDEEFVEESKQSGGVADRIKRADKVGTSRRYGRLLAFPDHDPYNYGGYGWMERSELKKLTDLYESDPGIDEADPRILELVTKHDLD